MTLETFHGPDLGRVLAHVRALHGDNVMIVRTIGPAQTGTGEYEVVVAGSGQIERLHRLVQEGRTAARRGQHRVAVVGPAGAGKTTTIARLALHAAAFGNTRVGLLTLDTYRIAGLEQLQVYADIAGLPIEVAYDANDLTAALDRLRHCETVLIDTPGRIVDPLPRRVGAPSHDDDEREWLQLLAAAEPAETHLVLPAGLRTDVAQRLAGRFAACRPTHVLFTHLDELAGTDAVADMALAIGLPMRWVSAGTTVPDDLTSARTVLAALGGEPALRRAG